MLVVEDDLVLGRTLVRGLRDAGLEVEIAPSGEAASAQRTPERMTTAASLRATDRIIATLLIIYKSQQLCSGPVAPLLTYLASACATFKRHG